MYLVISAEILLAQIMPAIAGMISSLSSCSSLNLFFFLFEFSFLSFRSFSHQSSFITVNVIVLVLLGSSLIGVNVVEL